MVDIHTFKMYLKKDNYCDIDGNYRDIEDVKASIEKYVNQQIEAYIDKRPNCYIVSVDTEWYEEEENYLLVATLTYKITPNVIDECLCF